jgi:phospholipase/lecithinase/hemolysin
MRSTNIHRIITRVLSLSIACLVFSVASFAQEKPFDRIVVFGASLSDSGNAFVLLSDPLAFGFGSECNMGTPANVPPYDALDDLLIPDGTYAKGGHHVTNGATWVEQLARGQGLSGTVRPALRNSGTQGSNYAVGGARASEFPCRFNLSDQLNAYLGDFPVASANTLVVIEIGGNDVRDALSVLPGDPGPILVGALTNIGTTIQTLYAQGARKFLIVNVPSLGNAPAVRLLDTIYPGTVFAANYLSSIFNSGLTQMQNDLNQGLPGIDVRTLDLYALLNEIIATPASFGLVNTMDACVTPNVPPFACKKPDTYLFWDGIHPTKVVHGIIAQRAADILMNTAP